MIPLLFRYFIDLAQWYRARMLRERSPTFARMTFYSVVMMVFWAARGAAPVRLIDHLGAPGF